MTTLFYDCFSGISGDMNLGAMLDLGVSEQYLREQLATLNLHGWEMIVERDQRHGIFGTKVTVKQTHHEHIHRHLSNIVEIIGKSALSEADKSLSLKIFKRIAAAEAKVHNTDIESVHFHEVGAIDSIIDIVGAAICFNVLGVEAVYSSPLELGGGFVKCAHGTLPIPAPATAELVDNIPISLGGVDFEATTPTGAAIIATLATSFVKPPIMKIKKKGYGIGQKESPIRPNILRVAIGEFSEDNNKGYSSLLMQCNIDDMNPELYEYVIDKISLAGADDVYLIPIIMKHGRPANILNVLCRTDVAETIKDIVFRETTTIGLRIIPFQKETLERRFDVISTTLGEITVKKSLYKGEIVNTKPEYSECRKIAKKNDIPIKWVYQSIQDSLRNE